MWHCWSYLSQPGHARVNITIFETRNQGTVCKWSCAIFTLNMFLIMRSCLYQDTRPPPSITKQLKDRSVNTAVISLWHRSEWLLVLALVALPVVCGGSFCRFLSISRLWYDIRRSLHLNHQQYPVRFPYNMYSYVTMKKLPLYYTCLTYRVCGREFGRRRGASRCPRAVHRQSPCTLSHTNKIQSEILNL